MDLPMVHIRNGSLSSDSNILGVPLGSAVLWALLMAPQWGSPCPQRKACDQRKSAG